jgi:hypothetical protein
MADMSPVHLPGSHDDVVAGGCGVGGDGDGVGWGGDGQLVVANWRWETEDVEGGIRRTADVVGPEDANFVLFVEVEGLYDEWRASERFEGGGGGLEVG